jgi:CHAT domain-containing protein/Tfp pilus assembly protein PilF
MHQRISWQGQRWGWWRLVLETTILVVVSLAACGPSRDPVAEFEHVRQLFLRGDLIRAQTEAEQAYRYYSAKNSQWSWKFRVLDARILSWRGMNRDVLLVLSSDLPSFVGNSDLDLQKQQLEGLANARLHRFAQAQQELTQAANLCAVSDCAVFGEVLASQGFLEVEKGEYSRAQEFFEKSLQFARQRNDQFGEAHALLALSNAALEEEHFDEAIDWASNAKKAAEAVNAGLVVEIALGNLGWACYKTGDSERALNLFIEANRRAEELGSVIDQVRWLTTTGYVYLDAGNFSVAEDYYRRALGLARKIDSKEEILNALLSLAFVTVQTRQLDLAKQYSEEAIALARADGNRLDELYPMLAKGQVALRSGDSAQAEQIFREIATDPKVDPSLQWEAQHELAGVYEDEHRFPDADKLYRTALSSFEAARSSLHHEDFELPFMTNGARLYDDYIHFLLKQGKTTEALQTAEYSRAQTLAEGLGLLQRSSSKSSATVNPLQIARDVGGTILFYWLGPKQSCLWVVTKDQIRLFQLPPAPEIDAAVQNYRKALMGSRDVLQTANPEGTKLFDILVGPAWQAIASNSRVIVIPDGSLNGLNFETLLVPDPKLHYWIEDVTVVNASSLRLLAASHKSSKAEAAKLLLMGDAVSPDPEYGELPEAALEITNIEKHFTPAERQVYTRMGATAPAYLGSAPEQFAYIHFVAHGTASRLSPLDSAVILSKSSAEQDSFKLYARDIIHRPLHAELVTISTCYGTGSRAYTGEGLVGLSWAFLRAGAHNVIGALWEVSDASTPRLMDQLYDELMKGRSPEAALRSAKLSLLHSDGVFRKPFYWAPFQLYTGT